jgi:hypothetical protein
MATEGLHAHDLLNGQQSGALLDHPGDASPLLDSKRASSPPESQNLPEPSGKHLTPLAGPKLGASQHPAADPAREAVAGSWSTQQRRGDGLSGADHSRGEPWAAHSQGTGAAERESISDVELSDIASQGEPSGSHSWDAHSVIGKGLRSCVFRYRLLRTEKSYSGQDANANCSLAAP